MSHLSGHWIDASKMRNTQPSDKTSQRSARNSPAPGCSSGSFQVIARRVSTWVQEILNGRPAAVATLGNEVKMPPAASASPDTSSAPSILISGHRARSVDHGRAMKLVPSRRGAVQPSR